MRLKRSRYAAAEIATHNERGGLGFARDEARACSREGEIRHVDGGTAHLSKVGSEGKGGSAVGVGERRGPVAVDVAVGRVG
jgi:hypothetical protein